MRLAILDHHGKSQHLADRLAEAGFDLSPDARVFDYELLLVDSDSPYAAPMPLKHQIVKEAVSRGVPIVLYPHGAHPDLDYDGIRRFTVPISLQLLHGEGNAEIYRRCGLTHRYEVVGWTYCETGKASTLLAPVSHLLFAPIHPWANGIEILLSHKALNERAYQEFLAYPADRKTVRMYGADEPNGIGERASGIEYTQSDLKLGLDLIDSASAVLSYGTFAYTALARGKPVAMIYAYPAHTSDDGVTRAAHLADYADYVRYPASVGDAPLSELLRRDVSEWRRLFVGESLDIDKLAGALTRLRPNRATRRRLQKVR